jgi:hypothetical protein
MNSRSIVLGVASIAALVPAISNASPERAALDACAAAFASSLAAPGSSGPAFKVDYRFNQVGGSMLELYSRAFTFDLYANDVKTGAPIARASCSTNDHGSVVALSPVPLGAWRPTRAPRL